jgi:hypothetical protein
VGKYLRASGEYFLDAGSGPLSQPEYVTYSAEFAYRVCIDLSAIALTQVRSQLGGHALCVVGDLAHLPFGQEAFDTALASHVLYHVPEDEQLRAIQELHRTMKRSATCVIVYMWPTSAITKIGELSLGRLARVLPMLSRWLGASADAPRVTARQPAQAQLLYFQPHNYRWFRSALPAEWRVDIRSWRAVDRTFSRRLIGENIVGATVLRFMYFLEDVLPHVMGRLGRYPMIVIEK